MKAKTTPKNSAEVSAARETQRLIKAATKHPGVTELLRVYKTWQAFNQVFEAQSELAAVKQIVSASSSSFPLPSGVA
jgi:hypothetical protein